MPASSVLAPPVSQQLPVKRLPVEAFKELLESVSDGASDIEAEVRWKSGPALKHDVSVAQLTSITRPHLLTLLRLRLRFADGSILQVNLIDDLGQIVHGTTGIALERLSQFHDSYLAVPRRQLPFLLLRVALLVLITVLGSLLVSVIEIVRPLVASALTPVAAIGQVLTSAVVGSVGVLIYKAWNFRPRRNVVLSLRSHWHQDPTKLQLIATIAAVVVAMMAITALMLR